MTRRNISRANATASDIQMEKRDIKFGRDNPPPRWWHGNDAGRTAFFNALSSTFPQGEKFFMTAVRHYRDAVDPVLRGQIDDFLYQESMHSREHVVFNRQAEDAGYDITALEQRVRNIITWARRRPPIQQLAATCALEHYTAALAQHLLSQPSALDGATAEAGDLWRWHAIEEIEHKAVAYDTYVQATQNITPFRRWLKRCLVMAITTVRFHYIIYRNTADLLRQDGLNNLATWKDLLAYLYGRDGAMRHLILSIGSYMRPGFHPWDEDDRALLTLSLAGLHASKSTGQWA